MPLGNGSGSVRRPFLGEGSPLARKLFLGRSICRPWLVFVSALGKVSALKRRRCPGSGDFLRRTGGARKPGRLNQRHFAPCARKGVALGRRRRPKLAAREMGKVLGFQPDSLSRLSAVAGSWEWRGADDTFDEYFRKAGFDLKHSRIACFPRSCFCIPYQSDC